MHLKYFQSIADIKNHYEDILYRFEENSKFDMKLLNTWDIFAGDKEEIAEEYEALRYLIGCRFDIVRDNSSKKPSLDTINRCFTRHIDFLNKIFKIDDYNVNKHSSKNIRNQFKACRHYLFKFSLNAWYRNLPDSIPTLQEKYSHINL